MIVAIDMTAVVTNDIGLAGIRTIDTQEIPP
jgi:hypothetical protein